MITLRYFDEAYLNDLGKRSSFKTRINDENIVDFLNGQGVDIDVSKWREVNGIPKDKATQAKAKR